MGTIRHFKRGEDKLYYLGLHGDLKYSILKKYMRKKNLNNISYFKAFSKVYEVFSLK